jgi:hypothetical protein
MYTRRLRERGEPNSFRASVIRHPHANSHMKIIGNHVETCRGIGVSVRNARSVHITDDDFAAPADDPTMCATLAEDKNLRSPGRTRRVRRGVARSRERCLAPRQPLY